MQALSPIDLAIVGVYVASMTLFGVWFTNRQKDLRAYFVGDRSAAWPMILLSIVATETSAVTFLSVPGVAYDPKRGNFLFLQLAIGYIVGRIVVSWFLLPQYMGGNLFSAYQVLRERFGPGVQRLASGVFLLTRTVADGLRLYLTALLIQYVGFGVELSIIAVGVVTIFYTYLGGMKAVLWTDVIQFTIKIVGAAYAAWYALHLLPGGWDYFLGRGTELGRFHAVNTSFAWDDANNIWVGVIGGAVLSMGSHGADQLMVQRYLCAKSLGHARAALTLSGLVVFAQFVLFLGLGVALYLLHESGGFPEATGAANDEAFGLFIVKKLPVGLVGLLVAAVLAAAMSTLSSSLNSSANAFVNDFYKPLSPQRSERHYVALSRAMTAVWGLLQMAVAYVAFTTDGGQSVVKQVLSVAGMTTGLLLGVFVLGSLPRPVPSQAAFAGFAAGALAVGSAWAYGQVSAAGGDGLLGLAITPGYRFVLAWPWYAPLGAATTAGVALIVHSLSGRDR